MHHDEQVTCPEIRLATTSMLDHELPKSRPPRPVDPGVPADPPNLLPTINGGSGQTVSPTNETTLHGARLWSLIGGLYLAVYLVGLDLSMLSTVIPKLSDYFHRISDVGWYEIAYLVPICVLQPLAGQIYTVMPSKHTYLAFFTVFELGSLACAVAPTSPVFIIGRAITGIGAAGLMNGGLVIISAACPPRIRPMITGAAISLIPLGGITGPLIAGALTDHLGWKWCFWIFLPVGAVTAIIIVAVRIPEQAPKPPFRQALSELPRSVDPVGFLLFAPAIIELLLAISWGGADFAWSSPTIIGLFCGSVATMIAFAMWSRYAGERALIPRSTMLHPLVVFGSAVVAMQGGSTTVVTYYLPLWFQAIQGVSAVGAGVRLLPSMISMIAGMMTAAVLVRRLHYVPPWAIAGSILSAVGTGLLTTLSVTSTTGHWIGYQILTGYGRGMALQIPVIAVQESLPSEELAMATSSLTLLMYLGSAIGTSVGQTIFRSGIPGALAQYAPFVDPELVINTGATEIQQLVTPDQLPGLLRAYNEALTQIFFYPTASAAVAVLLAFGLGWKRIGVDDDSPDTAGVTMSEMDTCRSGTAVS
ncbi:hypothetical protein Asppvi_011449 [Aspergillus pseudoviridinutans]|uniref:Major facilitator superfamily (MFS) profile domain-containing protein n=1 Tax=Aspergillus pseudoviridinutans TaxID=1517512 RepID=A0A9P3F0F2_9EURO|nr:uncharacterized protein Asppvi_011449 [Aspergillus pseudoviridinutans]GIJ92467.1 hypothetical protein Asppvi_011449 [Aspergillus pseudoviridinutans]